MKPLQIFSIRNLIFICLISSGCSVSKPFAPPAAPATIDYHEPSNVQDSTLTKWFNLYGDTVLREMIQTALDSNRDLLTAAARIEEAAAQAAITRANLYPQVGYQAKAGGGHSGTDARKISGGYQGGVINGYANLNWEIDIWGKLHAAKRSAIAAYFSQVANRNAVQVSLVAAIASQYFLLRDLDNRLQISQQTLAARKLYTKLTTEQFNGGYIAEVDRLLAVQQEAAVAATIPALQLQIVQTENALRLLMGKGPGSVKRSNSNFQQTFLPQIPAGLSSQLLERRPDIIAAEQSLQSQYERIGVARAGRFPSLSLTGLLGFASPELSTLVSGPGFVANGFAGITGPLFNFNQLKNQVKAEQQKTQQALLQYQQTVLNAFIEVDNSLVAVKRFDEQYEQLKIMADVSAKGLVLTDARYNHGFTSYLEVLVQQNNLLDSQLQQSIALQAKLNAIVMLYKSLGGGW